MLIPELPVTGVSLDAALLAVVLGVDKLASLLCDVFWVLVLEVPPFDVELGFSASISLVDVTRLEVLDSIVDDCVTAAVVVTPGVVVVSAGAKLVVVLDAD